MIYYDLCCYHEKHPFQLYAQSKTFVIRDFIKETIDKLSPEKQIEVTGSHLVHVALNKLNGKTYINLINVAGEHTNPNAVGYDQVQPLSNLLVSINGKASKVVLQPEGKELTSTYVNGKTVVVVPLLEIHSILEVNE